jgi:pimeloyl-ACP methyl ester carboxylesterase
LDWPRDVAEAADKLGIGDFAVLGVSGGCPYALVCGYVLGDRVTGIGIVVGMGPLDAVGMEQATGISGPSAVGLIRRLQFGMAAFSFRKGQEVRFVEQSVATMGHADQEVMARPEVREWFTELMRESFQQGGRAAAHEAGLYRRRWGFDPQESEQGPDSGTGAPTRRCRHRQDGGSPTAYPDLTTPCGHSTVISAG